MFSFAPGRHILPTKDARFALSQTDAAKPVTLTGYAIVWNVMTADFRFGGFRVRLLPMSAQFATPTHCIWAHDMKDVLGNNQNGTLRLTSDAYGVRFECDLPKTVAAGEVAEQIRRGDVKGCSFGMGSIEDAREEIEDGNSVLNIAKFTAYEISVGVAQPAFPDTSVTVKPPTAPTTDFALRRQHAARLDQLKLDRYRLPGTCPAGDSGPY